MNKKLFFGMFAAASMMLATSCSNDELDSIQSGNEARVTFSIETEGSIATRAISDGKSANMLVYAVFDESGNRISTINKVTKENVSFPTKETVTLAKGQTYQVAFWAQNADCKAYTVSEDMKVTVKYTEGTKNTSAVNNDETRDAFFKAVKFTVNGNTDLGVELKRPFAQINVGVTKKDWDAAVASGVTIKQSSVVIKNAATSINLLTGEVDGNETVTYSLADIPKEETLNVDVNRDKNIGEDEQYQWLSMSYILVSETSSTDENGDGILGDNQTTLESLQFTFAPEETNSKNIVFAEGLNTVNVRRNWRTNILGQILTGDIDFNISIDPIYDGDCNYPDGDAQELEFAATFGGTVTLKNDVTLTEPLIVSKDMVINLNNHSITGGKEYVEGLTGTDISTINGLVYGVYAKNGNLTIKGGSYIAGTSAVQVGKGTVNIEGGLFSVKENTNATYLINCLDNDYRQGNAIVNITGGTFKNFNPADNAAEGKGTSFVADGYHAVSSDNEYVVVANEINVVVTDTDLTTLGKNQGILLANDITTETTVKGYGKADIKLEGGILDGNGKTLSVESNDGGDYCAISTTGGTIKNLTIDNGFRAIFLSNLTQDVLIENVVLYGEGVGYCINTGSMANGEFNLTVNKSTLNGWTSFSGLKSATFNNCSFGQGIYYTDVNGRVVKPYVSTVFENCEFNGKFYIDLSALIEGATVTLRNCTVNGVKLTTENWTQLIEAESTCGESQISVELKDNSYLTATNNNNVNYFVIE